jgi:membrane-bound serine protease (ClpP class)
MKSLMRPRCCGPWLALLGVLAAAAWAVVPASSQAPTKVLVTDMRGAISVAAQRQLTRALETAQREGAEALIIRLDTPGGLVSATREMIQEIIAAKVAVIVYVAPSGARAASAGTFLVYASHVAVMAPGTNLGAATPVQIGGVPGLPGQPEKDKDGKKEQTASERKAINDTVAMLRSLAQLRGRNVEFAEKAVREAATLTAEEAAKQGVIEAVADDIDRLLDAIDGRKVRVAGAERTLSTKGATHTIVEPDWRTRLLGMISDPNIAFILLMIGFYGVILEFWNPGTLIPGTIGGVSIILALVALSALPVHYGALALLILGIGLMIAEAFTPGLGVLGIGGLLAFVVGSIFLFEGADWDIEVAVSWPIIFGAATTTAVLIFGIVGAAMQARKRKPATGAEEMIGSRGVVVDWADRRGSVRVHGEVWSARSEKPLRPSDSVQVVGRDGLTLIVEP